MRPVRLRFALVILPALAPALFSCSDEATNVLEQDCATKYPMPTLAAWMSERLSGIWTVDGVSMTDVDETKQCLVVGVTSAAVIPEAEARLLEIEIPRDAVYFTIVQNAPVATRGDDSSPPRISFSPDGQGRAEARPVWVRAAA